jgi:hypothetical protein
MVIDKSIAQTFAQRLAREREELEKRLKVVPAGSAEHDAVVSKIRKIDTAATIDGWLASRELQPPT